MVQLVRFIIYLELIESLVIKNKMNLEHAIEIAVVAHKGQKGKSEAPYILHPLRVMLSLSSDEDRIVGILHDVVEDTSWTFDQLREGFGGILFQPVFVQLRTDKSAGDGVLTQLVQTDRTRVARA